MSVWLTNFHGTSWSSNSRPQRNPKGQMLLQVEHWKSLGTQRSQVGPGPGRLRSPCHGRDCSLTALISFLHFVTIPEQEIIFNFVIITTSRFHSQLLSVCCCTRTKCGINTNRLHKGKVPEVRNYGSPGDMMLQVDKSITSKTSLPPPKNRFYKINLSRQKMKKSSTGYSVHNTRLCLSQTS